MVRIPVTFTGLTANGNETQISTQLTLTFSQAITGLAAGDISLGPNVSSIAKTLSDSGPAYILTIGNVTATRSLSVAVAKSGFNVSGSPQSVDIFYCATGTIIFPQMANAAPSITGPNLYRVSNNGPTNAVLTVDNPNQYDSISWSVNGTAVPGIGPSFP